ncbi:hypothetical protein BH09ACT6_BH09ACT6_00380 [soil metagenome]
MTHTYRPADPSRASCFSPVQRLTPSPCNPIFNTTVDDAGTTIFHHDEVHLGIAVRSFAHFSLTYDHRIVDGADAARFLTEVRSIVERGEFPVPQC